jgi:hypothetical protein
MPNHSRPTHSVIPTEATDGFIVRCVAEGPPHLLLPLPVPAVILSESKSLS